MRLAKLLVSLGIIATVVYLADPQAVLGRLAGADLTMLGIAALALTLVTVLMALRWKLVAADLGLNLDLRHAIAEYYLSNLINQLVPGGVVGDASRAVRQRARQGLSVAAKSVIIERLVGQCVLMGVMACGFTLALLIPGGIDWPGWSVLALGICVAGAMLVGWVRRDADRPGFARELANALSQPRQLGVSVVIAALLVLAFHACARATGTALGWEAMLTTIPLILSAMIIPLSVGGWGWREGAAALLFPLAGASAQAGVAAGVAYGAISLIAALPALAFLLTKSSFASRHLALRRDQTSK